QEEEGSAGGQGG
nr:Chain B, Protein AMBP [Homo sapiens]